MVTFILTVMAFVIILAILFTTGVLSIDVFVNVMSTVAIFIPILYLIYIIQSCKTSREKARYVANLIPLFVCN